MSSTEAERSESSAEYLVSKDSLLYGTGVSDTAMAETPLRRPIAAFALALRHSTCSHADYLYFSDICLSRCTQEADHVQQRLVNKVDFSYSKVIFIPCVGVAELLGARWGRTAGVLFWEFSVLISVLSFFHWHVFG